jgi:hypothetical protein
MPETGVLQQSGDDVRPDFTESAQQMSGKDQTLESNDQPRDILLRKMIASGKSVSSKASPK